jgi:hypothetical protein
MKRGLFLQLFCAGIVMASAATPAEAITSPMPLSALNRATSVAPEPGVATSQDMDRAKVEKAWYGHWRRVNRRVYRRHYYYHHPYHYYHRRYYY